MYINLSFLLISFEILNLCYCLRYNCRTPLGKFGSCVSLQLCPEILELPQKVEENSAKQYTMQLKRLCGNRMAPDQQTLVSCKEIRFRKQILIA